MSDGWNTNKKRNDKVSTINSFIILKNNFGEQNKIANVIHLLGMTLGLLCSIFSIFLKFSKESLRKILKRSVLLLMSPMLSPIFCG